MDRKTIYYITGMHVKNAKSGKLSLYMPMHFSDPINKQLIEEIGKHFILRNSLYVYSQKQLKTILKTNTNFLLPQIIYATDPLEHIQNSPRISIVGTRKIPITLFRKIYAYLNKLLRVIKFFNAYIITGNAYGVDKLVSSLADIQGLRVIKAVPHVQYGTKNSPYELEISPFPSVHTKYYKLALLLRNQLIANFATITISILAPYRSGTLYTLYHSYHLNKQTFTLTYPRHITQISNLGNILMHLLNISNRVYAT